MEAELVALIRGPSGTVHKPHEQCVLLGIVESLGKPLFKAKFSNNEIILLNEEEVKLLNE
jgi:hypothetical protein